VFDETLVKLIKFPAEHLTIFHGTLVFRRTPVENHCSSTYKSYAHTKPCANRLFSCEPLELTQHWKC